MAHRRIHPWHEKITSVTRSPINIIVSLIENGTSAHWHKEIEIVYILGGSMQIGVQDIDYFMKPGDMLFIGSCDVHRFDPNPLGCQKIILQLDKSALGHNADEIFSRRFLQPHIHPDSELEASDSQSLHSLLERNMKELYEEWQTKDAAYDYAVKARANDLLAAIIRYMPMASHTPEEKSRRLDKAEHLDKALRFIEENYDSNITLGEAANVCGYSVYHFSRFFKEATGRSFVDYVNAYRVKVAKFMLKDPAPSITDIAYLAGFNSIETFNRVFKRQVGCTPTVYRSKI